MSKQHTHAYGYIEHIALKGRENVALWSNPVQRDRRILVLLMVVLVVLGGFIVYRITSELSGSDGEESAQSPSPTSHADEREQNQSSRELPDSGVETDGVQTHISDARDAAEPPTESDPAAEHTAENFLTEWGNAARPIAEWSHALKPYVTDAYLTTLEKFYTRTEYILKVEGTPYDTEWVGVNAVTHIKLSTGEIATITLTYVETQWYVTEHILSRGE